jgi:hypothetical protein
VNVIERLEAALAVRWRFPCPECAATGVEPWSVCASCASERAPRRIDFASELLFLAASDLLKLARATDALAAIECPALPEEAVAGPDGRCAICTVREARLALLREEGT